MPIIRFRGRESPRKPVPTRIWEPRELRRKPSTAFDIFDTNKDGIISASEICYLAQHRTHTPSCIFDELKVFSMMEVHGDSVITRNEFCKVVSDPLLCNDYVLESIAQLCRRRQSSASLVSFEAPLGPTGVKIHPLSPVDISTLNLFDDLQFHEVRFHTITAALGVVQGLKKHRSPAVPQSLDQLSDSQSQIDPECRDDLSMFRNHDYDLLLDLYAVEMQHAYVWCDVFKMLEFPQRAYIEVCTDGGKVLATSDVVACDCVATKWTVRVTSRQLRNTVQDFSPLSKFMLCVRLHVVGFVYGDTCFGATPSFDIAALNPINPTEDALIGPFPAKDIFDKVGTNMLGSRTWVSADYRDYDSAIDAPCTGISL